MKHLFYLIFGVLFFEQCTINYEKMEKIKLFEYVDSFGYKNHLMISKKSDSLYGVFLGVELNMENKPIYYKSEIKNVVLNNHKFSFVLKNFEFGNEPAVLDSFATNPLSQMDKIPLILQYNLYFKGTISKNKIELIRTSDLYDSRFDKMIFIKQ